MAVSMLNKKKENRNEKLQQSFKVRTKRVENGKMKEWSDIISPYSEKCWFCKDRFRVV